MSGNFFPAPEAIVRELGPGPAVFYGRVWRYCQGGGTCFAGLATLATECGVSVSTVQRWTRELSDAGYIVHESGRMAGGAGSITTTRKWIMGGDGQNEQGVGQVDRGGRSKRPTGVGQNDLLLKEVEEKKEEKTNVIASRGSAQTKSTGKARVPRPLFDAFKEAFPTAPDSVAGRFNSECSRLGYTMDQWRAWWALAETRDQRRRGFVTQNTALGRFSDWCLDQSRATVPTREAPEGAPPNWADIVYTHDGTRRYPALALPRLGLEPYAPPSEWPTWYQQFEGVQS